MWHIGDKVSTAFGTGTITHGPKFMSGKTLWFIDLDRCYVGESNQFIDCWVAEEQLTKK